jgi:hypothetical protein
MALAVLAVGSNQSDRAEPDGTHPSGQLHHHVGRRCR